MRETEWPSNFRLDSIHPSNQLLILFPEELSRQYTLVPVGLKGDSLILAGPLSLPENTRKEIQTRLRRPIQVYCCSWHEYRRYFVQCYPAASPEPVEKAEHIGGILSRDNAGFVLPLSPGKRIATEEELENTALAYNLPHLSAGSLQYVNGLDMLLPPSVSRENVLPFGWAEGTLYYLIKDVQWSKPFESSDEPLPYHCQAVLTLGTIFDQVYQRAILRGQTKISATHTQIIDALIKSRKLRKEQGAYALLMQKQSGISARQVLFDKYFLRARDWLEARADILGLPFLSDEDIPDDFGRILTNANHFLPDWIVRKFHILPIVQEDGILLAGFDELDYRLIDLAEALTHLSIDARLMDRDSMASWIAKAYPLREPVWEENHFDTLLFNFGYLNREQLDECLTSDAEEKPNSLDELRKNGCLSEPDLVEALGYFSGYPLLSLDHFSFNEALIQRYPRELLLETRQLPLFETEQDVWIAVADPFQLEHLQKIQQFSGKQIWPVIVPYSIVVQTIQRFCSPRQQSEQDRQAQALMDALVIRGVLTRQQSEAALQQYHTDESALDKAVIQQNGMNEGQLARDIAAYYAIQYEELTLREETTRVIDALGVARTRVNSIEPVDVGAANQISLELAQELCALPVRYQDGQLVVAFADPLFQELQRQIELILQKNILPVLSGRQELEDAITRVLGRPKLGSVLLMAGMVTRTQLNDALEYAAKANIRLGKALVFKRYLTEEALYQFLAQQAGLPFFDLSAALVDPKAARLLDARYERENGVLPLSMGEEEVVLATVDPLNQAVLEQTKSELDRDVQWVLVSETDFERALEDLYRTEYLDESVSALLERAPEDSAYHVLVKGQKVFLVIAAILTVAWLIWNAFSFLIFINGIVTAFYLVFSVYKFRLIFKAISTNLEVPVSDEEVAAMKDAELPVYTVLVPVHREAAVLGEILKSLATLDYPAARLDILVLLEDDDTETIDKFNEINPPRFIQKVIVPNRLPKTKPKACNYGLIHARGEFVVIYDAEDFPDRDQLKRVVAAFRKTEEEVVCIQAKLNYYNRKQNILTEWFTVEYSMWFDLLLPGLDAQNAPIPLGGTSNHFKTRALLEAGAWDPYNVTEDADLGIRLFKRGYRTRIVDSTTYEEANSQFVNWIRQRSRWLKGYMQTWLVHMRHPIQLIKEIGFKNFMSFQYIVGGTFLTALLNPLYWFLTALWFIAEPAFIQRLFPTVVFYMGAVCLYIGTFVFTYINVAGAMRRGYYDMVRSALLSPVYWAMSSIASWKGFFQLIVRPHFWEKTAHGLYQKQTPPDDGETAEQAAS